MEPVTGAVVAAGKLVKAADESKLLERLVGPLFEAIGLEWADGYRRRNAEKVARKAARQVGDEQLALPGGVHPRVAHRILDDGSFVHEDVMQEYLAGLLAGSRTETGDDDRAAYYVDLVASMPASQVRLHHAIYGALATVHTDGEGFGYAAVLQRNAVSTPLEAAAAVVGVPAGLSEADAVGECLLGLHREGLIRTYGVSTEANLGLGRDDSEQICMAVPSHAGCYLALWAHAIRDADIDGLARILPCSFDPPGPEFRHFSLRDSPYS